LRLNGDINNEKIFFKYDKKDGMIIYPDDISNFKNTEIKTIDGVAYIVAEYYGESTTIPEYIETPIQESQPIQTNKIVTKLHFRNLFTLAEKISMLTENLPTTLGKEENPGTTISIVSVILDDFQMAETIDLNDDRTIKALQYLMSVRIITEDRLNMILSDMKPE
jgi:hypothetical protein